MSKTDKTHPLWIKLRQNPKWRVEDHNHHNGECDIPNEVDVRYKFVYGYRQKCGYKVSRLGHQHVWARCATAENVYRKEANAKARNNLRMDMQELKKMTREDIEDCEFISYPHRHQALWYSW